MLSETQVKKSSIALIDRLKNLDSLPAIAYKLMYPETGKGWTKEQTEKAIARYLMFLALKHLHPNVEIVPSDEIDRVWHTHILDTQKYAADCQQIFGSFLHHFPYFGIRNEADRQNLNATFARTQTLFKEHFGVSLERSSVCVLPHKGKAQPSVCVLPKPSVCILSTNVDPSRPCVNINLDSYFPTEIEIGQF